MTTPLHRYHLSFACLLFASAAHAHPDFPSDVAKDLGLAAPPDCSICHQGSVQSAATAIQPFVNVLRQLGLSDADDATSLKNALEADEACQIDSDGDGVPDITELKRGTNPSDGPGPPRSGCSAAEGGGATAISAEPVTWFQTGCAVRRLDEKRGLEETSAACVAAVMVVQLVARRRATRTRGAGGAP